jgi:hypothetical protein
LNEIDEFVLDCIKNAKENGHNVDSWDADLLAFDILNCACDDFHDYNFKQLFESIEKIRSGVVPCPVHFN